MAGLSNQDLSVKNEIRKNILGFQGAIKGMDGAFIGDSEVCPLKHTFSDGIYVREIFIPAGTYIVGKIHKHSHPNFLLKGEVDVVTESGNERLVAPLSMISPAGTKRALYAVTDLVWVTVHHNPTNTQDLEKLERIVIADDYESYEKFIYYKNNTMKKVFNKIINKLNIF
jgi:hypothetical protein